MHHKNIYLIDLEGEKWLNIKGYEGHYMISNMGRVKALSRKVAHSSCGYITMKERILSQKIKKNGYTEVNLALNGVHSMKFVHILVATAFLSNPYNLPEVNHLHGIKHDNRSSELEWSTSSDNQRHSYNVLNRDRKLGRTPHNKGSLNTYLHIGTGLFLDTKELCSYLGIKRTSSLSWLRSKNDYRLKQFIKV